MKILKAIGTALFVGLLAIGFVLFIVIGMAVIALGDFVRFMGIRYSARLRGDRFRPDQYVAAHYDGPRLVMDADGFVEPPQSRALALAQRPPLQLVRMTGSDFGVLPSYGDSQSVRPGLRTSGLRTPAGFAGGLRSPVDSGVKVLEFPVDPAAHRRLQAACELERISQSGVNSNLVVLSQHRRQPDNVVVLAHYRPFSKR